jgi:diguanylate cyclase (GGDEF)-like protein/PAS domain S-box-containing protein
MSKERIYIVEDERIIAIDLQRRLERLGYQVCGITASGEEALMGVDAERPDLVLMDIVLQGAIDGIEVAVRIKKDFNIPSIFLTAYTDMKTLERAKQANPLGYVLKPFKERELATTLEIALFKNVADNRIREKEQLFSAILNSTTDAILVIGKNGEVIFLNPEAEQILEVSDADSKNRLTGDLFTLFDVDSGEQFQIPLLGSNMKTLKARNLRLTNWKQHSFVVDMTVNRKISENDDNPNYIVSFKDISRLHEMTDTLKYQTSHDTLTGLLNRNEFALRLNSTLSKLGREPASAFAIFVDIDHFKVINDSCGTQAGDQLLRETAARIRSLVDGNGFAARLGGDDFVLVYVEDPGKRGEAGEIRIAKALIDEAQKYPFRWNGKEFPITVSVGVVELDPAFKNEHEVMIAGTQTVIDAHESGGNKYLACAREKARGSGTIPISEWISLIHESLTNDRFRLYYQPIQPLGADGGEGKLEILLRMIGKDGAVISPGDFIPIAERYNLMPAVDRWVIKNSFIGFKRLAEANDQLARRIFCVNLSGASLVDESIIGFILDAAAEHGIPTNRFCVEVTETNAILNLTSASRFMYILKERGFTFALDDFGSGFSSFSYLKNLPVDYLKIDGCFIRNMDRDDVDVNMVQAISSMCRVLGLKTIGEFAENETIISKLREIGVDYAQGYGISKPMPLIAETPA